MSLKIDARKVSQDPLQESLRQRKQIWNKACSEFIARLNAFKPHLIAFKRGLNGRGDQKAGLPISNIKDPIPTEISSYLGNTSSEFGELASTFSALVAEANGIIQEQAEYSDKRRKSQPRAQNYQQSAPTIAQVSSNEVLIVEASNSLTRFWAHLSSFLSSDKNKTMRLSMLGQANKLFKNLVKFEDNILEKGIQNVPSILTSYFLVVNNFKALKAALSNMLPKNEPASINKSLADVSQQSQKEENSIPSANPETPIAIQSVKPNIDNWKYAPDMSYETMKNNVAEMVVAGLKDKDANSLFELYEKLINEKNENKIEMIQDRLHFLYQALLKKSRNKFKKKSELLSDSEITKVSSSELSRLFKKYKHQFGVKEPSSATRLEIYELVKLTKKQIDSIMDLLEKRNLDPQQLIEKMKEANQLIEKMKEPVNLLNILYQDKYYESDAQRRNMPLIDPASRYFTRQIRQDVDKPGW